MEQPRDMTPELVRKYAAPVPRYTSYPTAPHFSASVDHANYVDWLAALRDDAPLSLYVHIPFCDTLCWYCGCTTKAVRRYRPVAAYLRALLTEIETVAAHLSGARRVSHIQWGGGSPDILRCEDIPRLAQALRDSFNVGPRAEFAVEIDPRQFDAARAAAFRAAGVTRVSFGVQDFDAEVQQAINRHQSFSETRAAVDLFRQAGVRSVNIDLVYGLPRQTRDSVARTIDQVLSLAPDRIALFGYAHLPARLPHQRLIDAGDLPGPFERFEQSRRAASQIVAAGYVRIGLDHFAKPGDALASGPVRRNFQGYTSDTADMLIGFGASAIGRLPQGYVQNATPTGDYIRRVADHGLAVARGFALSQEDRARGFVINRLMCDLAFPAEELSRRYGGVADKLLAEADSLLACDDDGLVEKTPSGFRVTEQGRPFVRSICARFDAYRDAAARYSIGV